MAVHAESSIQLNTIPAYTSLLGGHFIYKIDTTPGTLTPSSANIIQNSNDNPSQWGYNTHIGANGIKLRYNETTLSEWINNCLTFYKPGTTNPSLQVTGGNNAALNIYNPESNAKTLGLNANGLSFYGTSVSAPDVTLNADGLTLINGSIRGGVVGQDEFLYLSPQVFADEYEEYILSTDTEVDETKTYYTRSGEEGEYVYTEVSEPTGSPQENEYYEIAHAPGTIPIDNYVKNNWRQIIGRNFAVDTDGNLYANGLNAKNANIEGEITATSLIIGNGSDAYNGEAAINVSGYDIVIYEDSTDSSIIDHENTTYLYPVMYHNGEVDGTVDNTHYIWFMDNVESGTTGDAAKGGIIASYGHSYRVTYDFDDSAVGTGTLVQERIVDPSKYITKISDTGITIHPEFNTNTTSIQLDGTGLDIIKNGVSIAKYSTTARIGQENNSRFLINTNSLQAYSGTEVAPYFEVNANGLTWGSNIAATTTQVDAAAQTATNFIKIDGTGIKVQTSNDTTDYLYINSDKIALYRNNVEKLRLTDSLLRLGATSSNISIDADGMSINKNGTSIAYYGDTSRIGKTNSAHTVFTSSGMQLWTGQETEPSNQVATFGARSKIGKPTGATMIIAPNSYQDGASNSELIQFRDIIDGEEKVVTKITTDGIWTGLNTDSAELSVGGMTITVSGQEYWGGLGFLRGEILNKEQGTSGATASVRLENNFTRDSMHTCSTVLSNYWQGDNYISVDGSRTSYSSSNSGITRRIYMVTDLIHMDASIVRTNDGVVQSSDRRFKEHLRYLGEDACNFIKQLKPAYFNRKGNKQVGFYAQDIEAIDPWQTFVMTDNEGFKLLNYTALIAPLVTYCQKLEQRIEELEKGD